MTTLLRYLKRDYSLWPPRDWAAEWVRPWKLVSFAFGLAWLIWGALEYNLGDWDIGVSVLMATLTYLLAPWAITVAIAALVFRRPGWAWHVVLALIAAWFVIDGSYVGYNVLMGHNYLREANAQASTLLFLIAGFVWSWRGSLRELFR